MNFIEWIKSFFVKPLKVINAADAPRPYYPEDDDVDDTTGQTVRRAPLYRLMATVPAVPHNKGVYTYQELEWVLQAIADMYKDKGFVLSGCDGDDIIQYEMSRKNADWSFVIDFAERVS